MIIEGQITDPQKLGKNEVWVGQDSFGGGCECVRIEVQGSGGGKGVEEQSWGAAGIWKLWAELCKPSAM